MDLYVEKDAIGFLLYNIFKNANWIKYLSVKIIKALSNKILMDFFKEMV